MPGEVHPAVAAHHDAARQHEQAAEHHHAAAEHHDAGNHEAAQQHATQATDQGHKAVNASLTAHELSKK